MSEELKLFLSNLAVASGVGLAVGALAAAAAVPVMGWWRSKVAGRGQSDGARHATAPLPGAVRGSDGYRPTVGPSPDDAATRVVSDLEGAP